MDMERLFSKLLRAVIRGDTAAVSRLLATCPELAATQSVEGATRRNASEFLFDEIAHYALAGDTALHIAAAAFERPAADLLIRAGADCRARNRRGAEPLHYASDANRWKPDAQRDTIEYLLSVGADPNALDKSGVTPLHRAVRTRASEAVRALVSGGARVGARNRNGSTPLHLAVRATGRGGAGSARARSEQSQIIAILLDAGARVTDQDATGKSVLDSCSNARIRMLLAGDARR